MGPFIAAWLVGQGIIVYRSVKLYKAPPGPGQLALTSGLFIALALLAEVGEARSVATLLAWGLDAAAFMKLQQDKSRGEGKTKKGAHWPPEIAAESVIIPGGQPLDTIGKKVN